MSVETKSPTKRGRAEQNVADEANRISRGLHISISASVILTRTAAIAILVILGGVTFSRRFLSLGYAEPPSMARLLELPGFPGHDIRNLAVFPDEIIQTELARVRSQLGVMRQRRGQNASRGKDFTPFV